MTNGKYQLTLGIIGRLINLIDGSLFTILPFCIRFKQLDYGFTNYQASLLSSIFLFKSVFTGPVTALSLDHFGRKTTIKFETLLDTSIGVMFYFCNTFFQRYSLWASWVCICCQLYLHHALSCGNIYWSRQRQAHRGCLFILFNRTFIRDFNYSFHSKSIPIRQLGMPIFY